MLDPKHPAPSHQKATAVVLAGVLILAVTGYFIGLRNISSLAASRDLASITDLPARSTQAGTVPDARDYENMRHVPKANHAWTNTLKNLRPLNESALQLEPSFTLAAGADGSAQERRAYQGAPPLIPHSIDQTLVTSCLACHADGKIIKDRIAPKVSHPHFNNCTQCHVPARLR